MNLRKRGFTLIELLVAVSLLSLLAFLAIPSLQSIWTRHQRSRDMAILISALNHARTTSLVQHAVITVCPYTESHQCGSDWTQGLLIRNTNAVLKIFPAFASGSHLSWKGFAGLNEIRFYPKIIATSSNGHFEYSPPGETKATDTIIINRAGQIRTE